MQTIKIGGNANKEEIKVLITRYFSNSKVNIQEEDYEGRFQFLLSLGKKKDLEDIAFYNTVANLAMEIILDIYAKQIIKERVARICSDYSLEDREEIIVSTHLNLMNETYFNKEKNMIKEEVLNHVIENNVLLIDGFINFRFKRFLYIIDISIEKAIGEIETEKEYLEFLSMLQYFVDIQEPKAELINVIIKDNDYFLLDKDNKVIENGFLDTLEENSFYEDISSADLLISSLIILSPMKLVIYIAEDKEKELMEVISQVFRDRVQFCRGCEICKIKAKLKKGK